jgi:hypothetical protein
MKPDSRVADIELQEFAPKFLQHENQWEYSFSIKYGFSFCRCVVLVPDQIPESERLGIAHNDLKVLLELFVQKAAEAVD